MKPLKKLLLTSLILTGFFSYTLFAQEEKKDLQLAESKVDTLNKNNHRLAISIKKNIQKVVIKDIYGGIRITGTSDPKNAIIITGYGLECTPEWVNGVEPKGDKGWYNRHLGISMYETDNVLILRGVSKSTECTNYEFYIPKNIPVNIVNYSTYGSKDIEVKDMESEIEISTFNPNIKCFDVTGPLTLSSCNGHIDVSFSKLSQLSPTSISLVNGNLNLSLPADSPTNFEFNCIGGGVFTNLENLGKPIDGKITNIGNGNFEKKINGGGAYLILSNANGNISILKK